MPFGKRLSTKRCKKGAGDSPPMEETAEIRGNGVANVTALLSPKGVG